MDFSRFVYRFGYRFSTKLISPFSFRFLFFTRNPTTPSTPHTHNMQPHTHNPTQLAGLRRLPLLALAIPSDPSCSQKFDLFRDFGPPFASTKKHQKNKLAQIHQNRKKSDLGRQRLQFGCLFDAI